MTKPEWGFSPEAEELLMGFAETVLFRERSQRPTRERIFTLLAATTARAAHAAGAPNTEAAAAVADTLICARLNELMGAKEDAPK